MIAEATKARPSGVGLKVWAFGGIDIVDHEEAARARMAVQGVLRSLAPKAATTICWKQCEFFEVIFGQDGWDCNL